MREFMNLSIFLGKDVYLYAILVFLGIIFILWGAKLARILSSLAFGLILAYLMYIFMFSLTSSVILGILASVIGLIIGILLGFFLLKLSISILGSIYATDLFIRYFHIEKSSSILILILFIIFAIIIYLVSSVVLTIALVGVGALMLWIGLVGLGLQETIALVIVLILSVIGIVNQFKSII